jgi:hypothetical protein
MRDWKTLLHDLNHANSGTPSVVTYRPAALADITAAEKRLGVKLITLKSGGTMAAGRWAITPPICRIRWQSVRGVMCRSFC